MNKNIERFLCSFFRIFNAHIEEINIVGSKAIGFVVYEDNSGEQYFSWDISNIHMIAKGIKLLDYIIANKLSIGDKLSPSRINLTNSLIDIGWNESEVIDTIDFLLSTKIDMLDDGEKTDSFFIH